MRLVAWIFTLVLLAAGLLILALGRLYPEARFGLFGLGPYPLWAWLALAFVLGLVAVFVWLPALHLRAAAERRRLARELAEARRALSEYKKAHPEEVPRIPDREPEGEAGA